MLWFGARLVVENKLSPGELSTFVIYAVYVGSNVGQLAGVVSSLVQVYHHVPALCPALPCPSKSNCLCCISACSAVCWHLCCCIGCESQHSPKIQDAQEKKCFDAHSSLVNMTGVSFIHLLKTSLPLGVGTCSTLSSSLLDILFCQTLFWPVFIVVTGLA